jgi:hypothetical protein
VRATFVAISTPSIGRPSRLARGSVTLRTSVGLPSASVFMSEV